MNLTKQLIDTAETKIIDSFLKAEAGFKKTLKLPTIAWEDMGRVAGRASYSRNQITLSPTLYFENQNDFVERTVVHESAHLVAYQVFGDEITGRSSSNFGSVMVFNPFTRHHRRRVNRAQPHGHQWKQTMRVMGVDASLITRCHSYDVSSVANVWKYKCTVCGRTSD